MKSVQMSFCVLGVLALSACSNTLAGIKADARDPNDPSPPPARSQAWEGIKADWKDLSDWAHNRPSAMERKVGAAPTGYAKRERMVTLQPPESMRSESGLVWKPLDAQQQVVSGSGRPVGILKPEGMVAVSSPSAWKDIGAIEERNMPGRDTSVPVMLRQTPPQEEGPQDVAGGPVEYSRDVTIFPVDGDATPYTMNFDPVTTHDMLVNRMAQQVFFGYGSATPGLSDRKALQLLGADLLNSGTNYHVSVVGHASKRVDNVKDPARKKKINSIMAEKRAGAVARELNSAGVPADRVTSLSRGDEMPNPHPGDKPQEAADRRVEVYIDGK